MISTVIIITVIVIITTITATTSFHSLVLLPLFL
jgi:hypothetical protein